MKASPIIEPLTPSIFKALESADQDVSAASYNFLLTAIKSKKPQELINLLCLNDKTGPNKLSSVRLRLIKDVIMWYSPSAIRTHRFSLEATLISGMHSPKEIQRAAREALILYMRSFPNRQGSLLPKLPSNTRGAINRARFKAISSHAQSGLPIELEEFAVQLSLSPKQLNALKDTPIDDNTNSNPLPGRTDIALKPQIISPASLKRQFNDLLINSEIPQGKRACTLPVDLPIPTYDIDAAYNAAFADSDSEVDAFIEFDFNDLSSFSLDSDDDSFL